MNYLIRRLEGLGYSAVAQIHGGMDWPEREEQIARFRDEEGVRFLIATDAAGEGINLQFCHLMVNYDIPGIRRGWNSGWAASTATASSAKSGSST